MKKLLSYSLAAFVAVACVVGAAPSWVLDEARLANGLWELARPPRETTRDFYFRNAQWAADLRTVAASVRFLWEMSQPEHAKKSSVPLGWTRDEARLLTHSAGSSNVLATPTPAGDPT